jgi:hypothetical protein
MRRAVDEWTATRNDVPTGPVISTAGIKWLTLSQYVEAASTTSARGSQCTWAEGQGGG